MRLFYPSEWAECEKICLSDEERVRRLRNKLHWLISNHNAHFIRLGFWDETFAKTSSQTRRRYVFFSLPRISQRSICC